MGWRIRSNEPDVFRDRVDAGARLAERLAGEDLGNVVVVALPRGGVPVAAEVARRLHAPLDVVVVRKLGVPWQPELALGAVGEGGVRVLNPQIARRVAEEDIDALTRAERAEVERRVSAWRGPSRGHDVAGRTVVLIDDGIATGATVRAAVAVLRARGAARVVLAVPVVAPAVAEQLRPLVDDLVALREPAELVAVGAWYLDFDQVDDAEVRRLLVQAADSRPAPAERQVDLGAGSLPALVTVPDRASGLVLFAHGAGSSRMSPRNAAVAHRLNDAGLATVLLDLLTPDEARDRTHVFDIALLADRLLAATAWTASAEDLRTLPVGYVGASTGAAAALWAAAERPDRLRAVVSRGGRPDLAGGRLTAVRVPTLLLVGERDPEVLQLNREAQRLLGGPSDLQVVPAATHLFEEPGALETVAESAAQWFHRHLPG